MTLKNEAITSKFTGLEGRIERIRQDKIYVIFEHDYPVKMPLLKFHDYFITNKEVKKKVDSKIRNYLRKIKD